MRKNNYAYYYQHFLATYSQFQRDGRRFCIRHIISQWQRDRVIDYRLASFHFFDGKFFDEEQTFDLFIWQLCTSCNIEGYQVLPDPSHPAPLYQVIIKKLRKMMVMTAGE